MKKSMSPSLARHSQQSASPPKEGSFAFRMSKEYDRDAQEIISMPDIMSLEGGLRSNSVTSGAFATSEDTAAEFSGGDVALNDVMRSAMFRRRQQFASARVQKLRLAAMWETLIAHVTFQHALQRNLERDKARRHLGHLILPLMLRRTARKAKHRRRFMSSAEVDFEKPEAHHLRQRMRLFARFSDATMALVIQALELVAYDDGEVVCQSGEVSHLWFSVCQGKCWEELHTHHTLPNSVVYSSAAADAEQQRELVKRYQSNYKLNGRTQRMNVLVPGDCFGDIFGLPHFPKQYSIHAKGAVKLWRLRHKVLVEDILRRPEAWRDREAFGAEMVAASVLLVHQYFPLSPRLFSKNPLFSSFRLELIKDTLLENMEPVAFAPTEQLWDVGDKRGDVYLLLYGGVTVSKQHSSEQQGTLRRSNSSTGSGKFGAGSALSGSGAAIRFVTSDDMFSPSPGGAGSPGASCGSPGDVTYYSENTNLHGDKSVLLVGEAPYMIAERQTTRATTYGDFTLCWRIDGAAFLDLLLSDPSNYLQIKDRYVDARAKRMRRLTRDDLASVPLFSHFSHKALDHLLRHAKPRCLERASTVAEGRAQVREMYLVVSGDARCPSMDDAVRNCPFVATPVAPGDAASTASRPSMFGATSSSRWPTVMNVGDTGPATTNLNASVSSGKAREGKGFSVTIDTSGAMPEDDPAATLMSPRSSRQRQQSRFFPTSSTPATPGDAPPVSGKPPPPQQQQQQPALRPLPAQSGQVALSGSVGGLGAIKLAIGGTWEGLVADRWKETYTSVGVVELWALAVQDVRQAYAMLAKPVAHHVLHAARVAQQASLGLAQLPSGPLPPLPKDRSSRTSVSSNSSSLGSSQIGDHHGAASRASASSHRPRDSSLSHATRSRILEVARGGDAWSGKAAAGTQLVRGAPTEKRKKPGIVVFAQDSGGAGADEDCRAKPQQQQQRDEWAEFDADELKKGWAAEEQRKRELRRTMTLDRAIAQKLHAMKKRAQAPAKRGGGDGDGDGGDDIDNALAKSNVGGHVARDGASSPAPQGGEEERVGGAEERRRAVTADEGVGGDGTPNPPPPQLQQQQQQRRVLSGEELQCLYDGDDVFRVRSLVTQPAATQRPSTTAGGARPATSSTTGAAFARKSQHRWPSPPRKHVPLLDLSYGYGAVAVPHGVASTSRPTTATQKQHERHEQQRKVTSARRLVGGLLESSASATLVDPQSDAKQTNGRPTTSQQQARAQARRPPGSGGSKRRPHSSPTWSAPKQREHGKVETAIVDHIVSSLMPRPPSNR